MKKAVSAYAALQKKYMPPQHVAADLCQIANDIENGPADEMVTFRIVLKYLKINDPQSIIRCTCSSSVLGPPLDHAKRCKFRKAFESGKQVVVANGVK